MMADGGVLFAIVPLSVMAEGGRDGSWRRDSLLAHDTLLSVVSLPEELFYPVANQTGRFDDDRQTGRFDDDRLVADAGVLLPATLAHHLGLKGPIQTHLDLGSATGRANAGDKLLTLIASALAGGDCIDDANALRAGGTSRVLGFRLKAASTLGTLLSYTADRRNLGPGRSDRRRDNEPASAPLRPRA